MPKVKLSVLDNRPPSRRRVADVLNIADSGASPRGSTYYGTLMKCPREFALTYEVGLRPETPSEALTVGWLYHHCLQLYYEHVQKGKTEDGLRAVYAIINILHNESGYQDTATTLENVLNGYFDRYTEADETWKIVAVEETLQANYKRFELSARLDLLILDSGLWIVEHKTARSISEDLIDNYQLDFQILAQVWLVEHVLDLKQFERFRGVRINITTKGGKTTPPKQVRVEVCPSPDHLKAFEKQVLDWKALRDVFEKLGWPQSFGRCSGYARGYSKCQYFNLCHGHPTVSVKQWQDSDPLVGFIKEDHTKHLLEEI